MLYGPWVMGKKLLKGFILQTPPYLQQLPPLEYEDPLCRAMTGWPLLSWWPRTVVLLTRFFHLIFQDQDLHCFCYTCFTTTTVGTFIIFCSEVFASEYMLCINQISRRILPMNVNEWDQEFTSMLSPSSTATGGSTNADLPWVGAWVPISLEGCGVSRPHTSWPRPGLPCRKRSGPQLWDTWGREDGPLMRKISPLLSTRCVETPLYSHI